MNNINVGIKELIYEFGINKNKVEFINDLNLFLNVSGFDESKGEYYDIIKSNFNKYMGKWSLDLENNFLILSRYIKSRKLPYKIAKDEGINMIKSEKFIISILVELYTMNIIMDNEYISKTDIIKFIKSELELNGLNISEKDIVLSDLEYLFRDKKLTIICKESFKLRKKELKEAFEKIVKEMQRRKEIKINLETIFGKYENQAKENVNINRDLVEENEKLKEEIKLINLIINEKIDKEINLQNEVNKLQKDNLDLLSYGDKQYEKALIDLVKNMNDDTNGNLLDRLYCYSKGSQDQNLTFITTNLFNVFRQMGILPRETIKIGSQVSIEEYSFYNYRLNRDISDIKLCEGEVLYPAWFYNSKEVLKPYVNIKGE